MCIVSVAPTVSASSIGSAGPTTSRAWRAGQWGGASVAGHVGSPSRSIQLDLRPRFYVVLKASGLARPTLFSSAAGYWKGIGVLEGSSSVSYAFPSELGSSNLTPHLGDLWVNTRRALCSFKGIKLEASSDITIAAIGAIPSRTRGFRALRELDHCIRRNPSGFGGAISIAKSTQFHIGSRRSDMRKDQTRWE